MINTGKICILDIDVQGAEQVKRSSLKAHYVFIAPPSVEELEKRLRGRFEILHFVPSLFRNTESEESIQKRINNARGEMEFSQKPGFFDLVLVNDDLDETYLRLKEWLFSNNNKL